MMFVVKRNGGGWDESYSEALFVTTDEGYVKTYCEKANQVFQRIKLRYDDVFEELEDTNEGYTKRYQLLLKWWGKLHKFHDVLEHIYEPIEVRS
jgi:hypothetical protein